VHLSVSLREFKYSSNAHIWDILRKALFSVYKHVQCVIQKISYRRYIHKIQAYIQSYKGLSNVASKSKIIGVPSCCVSFF